MRLFEMLLIITCLLMLLLIYNREKISINILYGLGIITGIVMGTTLLIEGFRWQMTLIYVLAMFFFIIPKRFKYGNQKYVKLKKIIKKILVTMTILLIILSGALAYLIPVYKLPKPTGTYMVGTQSFNFEDEKRSETLTLDVKDKRKLAVQLWYPTDNISNKKLCQLFPQDREIFREYKSNYSNMWQIPSFVFDYWKYIKSNSYRGAEIIKNKGSFPLVIISHGMATGGVLHTSQAENLASHGYIVVAIDHSYSTVATAFLDGRVTGFETMLSLSNFHNQGISYEKLWTEDIDFVINQIERLNSGDNMFKGKINLEDIGVMGHSFGGAVAFNACYQNTKIDAGIDMDGSLCIVDYKESLKKPFMFMLSENYINEKNLTKDISDDELRAINLTRDEYNRVIERSRKEEKLMNSVIQNKGIRMYIKGTEHMNFNDLQLISKAVRLTGQTGEINEIRCWNIVNKHILEFFNAHLKGMDNNLSMYPNSNYPEVAYK